MKLIVNNSDYIGVTSSAFCMLHCFATPFLFLSSPLSLSISQEFTLLWYLLNYIFLFLSFIAIYHSVKNSTNIFVKVFLYLGWVSLASLIIIETFEIISIPEIYTYFSGFSLAILHVYNLKYCRCEDDECCTT